MQLTDSDNVAIPFMQQLDVFAPLSGLYDE